MTDGVDSRLAPGDWAVLGVLVEAPAHGFGIARRLAPTSTIGQVWTMSRPRVYRAMYELAERHLIEPAGHAQSERVPARAIYAATLDGRLRLEHWLAEPVAHVRDVRSELLIKLALLHDRGESPDGLLAAQRATLEPIVESLEQALADATGFEAVVRRYRTETARSALAFAEQCFGAQRV